MWLLEIILEGFKSYATRTVISGFDPHFNAITGLNGSGKSNILDAICFVLGITNLTQVRVANLQELVYKQGQAGVTKATVTLVFDNTDKAQSPVGYEQYDQITITRQVVIGGRNKYLINGHNAQQNRVMNLFHSVQLNVNNPHFLIMQGRITKVLNMKPPEILALIEEAAGTRMFEIKRTAALKTIEKKDKKVEEITRVLNEEITPTLEKLRAEQKHYLQWSNNNQEAERLARFCVAYDYCKALEGLKSSSGDAESLQEKLNTLREDARAVAVSLQDTKDESARLSSKREKKMDADFKQSEAKVDTLSKEVVKHTAAWKHRKEAVASEEAAQKQTQAGVAETHKAIAAKEKELEKVKRAYAEAEVEAKKCAEALAELQRAQTGGSVDAEGSKTFTDQLMDAKKDAASAATELKALQMRIKHVSAELADKKKALKAAGSEQSGVECELIREQREYAACTAAVKELETALQKFTCDEKLEADLLAQRKTLTSKVRELRDRAEGLASRLSEADFEFADPEKGFDRSRVKGLVANLINVKDAKYSSALEVTAGGRLYNVIVDTENTGKLLLEKGKLKKRVTIIPLNKISSRPVAAQNLKRAQELVGKENVSVALSLVGYADELDTAMSYVFGSTLVCPDPNTAKTVAFDKDVRTRTVTLEGDVYDPAGTLTGGSRAQGGSILKRLTELNEARAQLAAQEAQLLAVEKQLGAGQADLAKWRDAKQKLELKRHELELLTSRVQQSSHHQLAMQVQELEAQLVEMNASLEQIKEREKAANAKVTDTESMIKNFETNREAMAKDAGTKISGAKAKVTASTKKLKAQAQEVERVTLEIEALRTELKQLEEQLNASGSGLEKVREEADSLEALVAEKKREYDEAKGVLDEKKKKIVEADKALSELAARANRLSKELTDHEMEAKKAEHKISRIEKDRQDKVNMISSLENKHQWVRAEKERFGKTGTEFDFRAQDPAKALARLTKINEEQTQLSKSINKKVMAMFEKAEAEYQNLKQKKTIIENDKVKLMAVIDELDEKKKEALQKTWEKVNKDFGSIFATLLPGTSAKLAKLEGEEIHKGLEVKVSFNGIWKESLTELSGGQRSLLALSLILALLLFKPAPMYILDEIDAALDLSHTQNIGQMLRTHFSKSQFIIVSLKEGMFNNANVLFKTKFVDGVSTVTRTVPSKKAKTSS